MGIYRKLQQLDGYLVGAHERIATKTNDLFGLNYYRLARVINYGRWLLLLPLLGYLRFVMGDFDPGLAVLLIVCLGIVQTLFCRDTIRTTKRFNQTDEQSYEVMPRSYLYQSQDQSARLGLLVGILPAIGLNGMVGMLNPNWGPVYLLVNAAFSLDIMVTISILYVLARPHQPKKGKLVLAFESLGNRLLSNLGWQRPEPVPQPND